MPESDNLCKSNGKTENKLHLHAALRHLVSPYQDLPFRKFVTLISDCTKGTCESQEESHPDPVRHGLVSFRVSRRFEVIQSTDVLLHQGNL